jgi:phospholipase/carboxylesterase
VAVLLGTLPFSAGLSTAPGQLAGARVLVAQGDQDQVIPRELLDRTWDYLRGDSGAQVRSRRDPGGHVLTPGTVAELGDWLRAEVLIGR